MSARVRFSDLGRAQAEKAARWWRANRSAARTLFADELSRAVAMLEENPESGRLFPRPDAPGLRVVVLRRTRYLVYYVHDAAQGEVLIAAVWSGLRGEGPPIRLP